MPTDIMKIARDKRDAELVEETLEAIGWNDVILPELEKEKRRYQDVLVRMTLNPQVQDILGRTKEEVAGCVYGIDILISTINRIIRKGASASKALEEAILNSRQM